MLFEFEEGTIPAFVEHVATCHFLAVRETDRPSLTPAEAFQEETLKYDGREKFGGVRTNKVKISINMNRKEMRDWTSLNDRAIPLPHPPL